MIAYDRLAAFVETSLDERSRMELEDDLSRDLDGLQFIIAQRKIDRALRSVLGPVERKQRLKNSILSAVTGAPAEQLKAQVLAETSKRVDERTLNHASAGPSQNGNVEASRRERMPGRDKELSAHGGRILNWFREVVSSLRAAQLRQILGTTVAIAVGLSLCLYFNHKIAVPIEVGQLVTVVGMPTIQHSGESGLLPAARSARVRFGDRVETGDADRAEIQFNDGTTLRLSFNSALEIPNPKSEIRNPKSPLVRPPEVNLLRGQVWTKVAKLNNAPQYTLRTSVATAVARGTEFGVKLQRTPATTNSQFSILNSQSAQPLLAVLTVKEGAVDFFNSFGTVQATAMTESTARADARPTEPKRLQTLQVVRLSDLHEWALTTSPLDWPDAAERLALGGGWAGLKVRDFPSAPPLPNTGTTTATNEVRVIHVSRSSPADTAGLRIGDILVAINGEPVTAAKQIEKAILLRPNAETTLRLRRAGEERPITLAATNRSSILPGPALSLSQRSKLSEVSQRLMVTPTFPSANSPTEDRRHEIARLSGAFLQAAAQNNLGAILEADDAMGPAIRAYGQAVYADPQVPLYRFNLGLALRKIGSFDRALAELETASRLAPESVEARKRLAEIHSLLGDDSGALAQTEAALQVGPQDHGVWELKAQILSKQHRFAEAYEAARKGVELESNCPVMRAYLADALHNLENLAEAETAYREALQLAPFDALLHMNLGTVQRDRGQLWPAEQSFRKAIELQPDLALAHRNLGNVLADGREFAQAEAALRKAAELDPNDAGAHRDLGLVALKQRKFAVAEKAYRAALEISPNDAEACYGLGQAHRERRQFADAERMYRKAIELKPDYANPYTGLGIVLHERGEFDEAEKLYRKAIELDPKESAPYNNLGNIYSEAHRDLDEAEKWFRKALELSPTDAEPRSGLALVALKRGKLAEAETLLRKARDLAPDSAPINNSLGEVLRQRGHLDEAEFFYKKALELDPDYIGPYGNLGILHAVRRQFAEAEKMFRALLQRTSGNARLPVLVNLASVCGDQGRLEEAEQLYRQALALAPNEPHVCNGFAYFLAEHHLKLDEALTLARRALQAAPNDANNVDTLGWVHFQRGELDEAEKTLKQALELAGPEPPASEIREHLKKLAERKGAAEK